MTWTASLDGTAYVLARTFAADGTAFGEEGSLATSMVALSETSVGTVLTSGRSVFAWVSETGGTSGTDIRAQIYGTDGSAVGGEFVINASTTANQKAPDITALSNGRFLVSWHSFDGAGNEYDIRGRIFTASGTALGGDIIINSTRVFDQFDPTVTALSGGRFAVSWYSAREVNGTDAIKARLFNADGSAATTEFIVNSSGTGDQGSPSITTLADGRIVATWESDEGGTGNDIRARLFTAEGASIGLDFLVNSSRANSQIDPSIAALSDGRFIVTWASSIIGMTGADIKARIFNANGTAAGLEFPVDTVVADYQYTPELTQLENGTVVVVWHSYSDVGAISNIHSATINPNFFQGIAGNDRWTGGSSSEQMVGLAGADTFFGMGGNDTLNGGAGNDVLSGGRGRDILVGGVYNDRFDFDVVADSGATATTRDVITDFRHLRDKIDLRDIDASTVSTGNAAFDFIGSAGFHRIAGELRFLKQDVSGTANDKTFISGDVNGDGTADFQIELRGLINLSATDFLL
ncbi:MAG: M10 family metallopeptidase C-terminal domain-containing protein [Paracoccaceae bacterium]